MIQHSCEVKMSKFFLVIAAVSALFISASAQTNVYECPAGWTNFLDKCYKYSDDTQNWQNSETHCTNQGTDGHLASIPNQQVQDFIKTTFFDTSPTFFWVGLSDTAQEGTWVWTDGTPYSYTNWGIFNGVQLPEISTSYNCMSISDITQTPGDWADAVCNGFAHHLCQLPGTLVTTTAAPTTTMAPTAAPTTQAPTAAPTTAAAPTPNPAITCSGQFMRFGDMCYRITKGLKTWNKAQLFCQNVLNGAELATIESQEVQTFLFDTFIKQLRHGMWVGLNSNDAVGTWTWIKDGSTPTYTNWATFNGVLQPENVSGKRCIATSNRQGQLGKWNDYKCSMKAWSICQRPAS
ncbi:C-type mannose receptor 2-like [Lineus longissimus]|uniref:C-type mannose receptor 2-like n=1 Tax=Lineus longissimus TaxID=88925 RepID=UPI002B4F39F5